ncbi:ComF family protein [Massilia aurea]|uniref:ComF family protein n=1 Tax=Massilia aurea TaxID=373040 RepID=UPI0034621C52
MLDLRPLPTRILQSLLGALLPSCCALCGGHAQAAVCADCERAYVLQTPRCPCCANPTGALDSMRHCGACLAHAPGFDATWVACDYAAPLDGLVLQLKFGAQLALAPWMARVLQTVIAQDASALPDVLCPVPLGPTRLIERGYNQALEVARPLARALGLPVAPQLLERLRDTAPQSGAAPGERRKNVRGAFGVDSTFDVRGRHIGVVDDVMSSGHTLEEIAAVLKQAGAARVTNIVFARTPPHA